MGNYFKGWYFKHQKDDMSLSIIPGTSAEGTFLQVIISEPEDKTASKIQDCRPWNFTGDASYFIPVEGPMVQKNTKEGPVVRVGQNCFSPEGISLNIHTEDLNLVGELMYDNLTPIKGDAMGPFRFFPMECRHSVVSMGHGLSGTLILSGRALDFTGGNGYIEGDRGRSFPHRYTWIQCNEKETSIMVSLARIPFAGVRFRGCICIIWHKGVEYRLATYNGVKIKAWTEGFIELSRGNARLLVEVLEGRDFAENFGRDLYAPQKGKMVRTIQEKLSSKARFRFSIDETVVFDLTSDRASFEYV